MTTQKGRRGRSKADWLEAALELLCECSVEGLTVERIASHLGIAKSGFYWHFRNRDEMLDAVLDFWTHELTEIATTNVTMLEMDPKSRLVATAEMILKYDLARYEIPIRQWALEDKRAARAVRKVNTIRSDYIRDAFAQLGFSGDDLDMRTMLFVCYQSFESAAFREIPIKKRRAMIARRVDLLTQTTDRGTET